MLDRFDISALVRIDKAEAGLVKDGDESPLTKLALDLYDEVFVRGEGDIARGDPTDSEIVERRVEAGLARRRGTRRPVARRTKRRELGAEIGELLGASQDRLAPPRSRRIP